jgi:exopolysaccharide/PEP-CTERM locus tyrosine autokinase
VSIIEKAASRIPQRDPYMNGAALDEAASIAVAERIVAPPTAEPAVEPAVVAQPASAATPMARLVDEPHGGADEPRARRHHVQRIELDLHGMSRRGLVTSAGGRTPMVEEFRIIKRPLIKRAFAPRKAGDNPGNLIMVTSSLPGEGKTFCAINLAMSIAMELDHTVLLVDADVARPSILRTLGVSAQRGLLDVLHAEHEMADVLLRTNVDTLTILPAGTSNANATEILASQSMRVLVQEIATRYPDRIVIFDSPPLLLTSEARVLASHMGQIAMVVESERTTQHAVLEALSQLEGCSNVNLIYNKSRELLGAETYDYHYG